MQVPCPNAKQAGILAETTYRIVMYFTYIIKSINHDYYYKGHCEDLDKRLQEHNSGFTISIKPFIPFKVVYFETFDTRVEAIKREKYFKSAAGRKFLKNKLQ